MCCLNRDWTIRLYDIQKSYNQIKMVINEMSFEQFQVDFKAHNSVIRDLEIIGEAVKYLPDDFKNKYPEIPWRLIQDMRNLLIHEYFGVDLLIVWKTASDEIDILKPLFQKL